MSIKTTLDTCPIFGVHYRNGFTDIKISLIKQDQKIIDELLKYISNFHGIASTVLEDGIFIKSSEGQGKRSEVLQKCFQNVLFLSELIKNNPIEVGFQLQVQECYQRIYFLSEYVFRLIAMQGGADFKQALNQHTMAWSLQCMGELLKRTAEFEHENARLKRNNSAAEDLNTLIRNMYDVCFRRKPACEYYSIQNGMIEKIKSKKYDAALCEHCSICEYLCTKLVRQEIIKCSGPQKLDRYLR